MDPLLPMYIKKSTMIQVAPACKINMVCKKAHRTCKAECCSCVVPIPREIWQKHKDKITKGYKVSDAGHIYGTDYDILKTEDSKCVFLNGDLSCKIYEDRPWVCKKFGDESCAFMTCAFMSKDGEIRTRQARRKVIREIAKSANKLNVLIDEHMRT